MTCQIRNKQSKLTGDGLSTATALLGKQLAEAVGAVGLVLTGRELLPGQHLLTVGALEAVAMEGGPLVGDASLVDHLRSGEGEILLFAGASSVAVSYTGHCSGDSGSIPGWRRGFGSTLSARNPASEWIGCSSCSEPATHLSKNVGWQKEGVET